jgi:hypothetical protein
VFIGDNIHSLYLKVFLIFIRLNEGGGSFRDLLVSFFRIIFGYGRLTRQSCICRISVKLNLNELIKHDTVKANVLHGSEFYKY